MGAIMIMFLGLLFSLIFAIPAINSGMHVLKDHNKNTTKIKIKAWIGIILGAIPLLLIVLTHLLAYF
jgi:hypothetical protein